MTCKICKKPATRMLTRWMESSVLVCNDSECEAAVRKRSLFPTQTMHREPGIYGSDVQHRKNSPVRIPGITDWKVFVMKCRFCGCLTQQQMVGLGNEEKIPVCGKPECNNKALKLVSTLFPMYETLIISIPMDEIAERRFGIKNWTGKQKQKWTILSE